ncbi:hypothetical protein [Streptomyces sp. NBC_00467]|uniref:hypothetical protein n=1 Tax=Streptomyces sp. NBC_00467 TaxID=2975752 RepID=UPI003FA6BD8A
MAEPNPALRVLRGLSLVEHEAESATLRALGFHPLDVTGYIAYGVDQHASIWEQSRCRTRGRSCPA